VSDAVIAAVVLSLLVAGVGWLLLEGRNELRQHRAREAERRRRTAEQRLADTQARNVRRRKEKP
jgi:CRP-like cAMP-binding protein